jgi:hypothetical protein
VPLPGPTRLLLKLAVDAAASHESGLLPEHTMTIYDYLMKARQDGM